MEAPLEAGPGRGAWADHVACAEPQASSIAISHPLCVAAAPKPGATRLVGRSGGRLVLFGWIGHSHLTAWLLPISTARFQGAAGLPDCPLPR